MYSLHEENNLISLAQQGNTSACEKLISAYAGLIKNMRYRYAHTPTGQAIAEDVPRILYLAFMEAIRDFNQTRGIHFAAFLQSRLHGAVYKEFKRFCCYLEHTAHPAAPPDEDAQDYFDLVESPQPPPEQKVMARAELASILCRLSKSEQNLLHLLYIRDLPQNRAARLLHISPQALHKQKQKLIAKLKKPA